jgi:hypothetical protein
MSEELFKTEGTNSIADSLGIKSDISEIICENMGNFFYDYIKKQMENSEEHIIHFGFADCANQWLESIDLSIYEIDIEHNFHHAAYIGMKLADMNHKIQKYHRKNYPYL